MAGMLTSASRSAIDDSLTLKLGLGESVEKVAPISSYCRSFCFPGALSLAPDCLSFCGRTRCLGVTL